MPDLIILLVKVTNIIYQFILDLPVIYTYYVRKRKAMQGFAAFVQAVLIF